MKINEKSIFVSTQNLIPCWTGFRPHVGTILAGFWGALEPLGSHFGCPGRSQAASQGSAWLSWDV